MDRSASGNVSMQRKDKKVLVRGDGGGMYLVVRCGCSSCENESWQGCWSDQRTASITQKISQSVQEAVFKTRLVGGIVLGISFVEHGHNRIVEKVDSLVLALLNIPKRCTELLQD